MAFVALTSSECATGKAFTTDTITKIKDDLDALYGASVSGADIPNGSFEVDSDADGQPDSWSTTAYAGGTVGLETTSPIEGAASLKFVHPGGTSNGGGYADSDYLPCSPVTPFWLGLSMYASQTGVKCEAVAMYYDKDKVTISSDTTILSTTAPPTSATAFLCAVEPPATARFVKFRLIGGYTDTDPGSSTNIYFDAVTIRPMLHRSWSPISFPTIAEQTETSGSWTDQASVAITAPIRGPVTLSFSAEYKLAVSGTSYIRFRVGTDYSDEVTFSDTSYTAHTFTLTTDSTGADIILTMQLKDGATSATYGRMLTPAGTVTSNYELG